MITEEIGAVTESPGDDASVTVRSLLTRLVVFIDALEFTVR